MCPPLGDCLKVFGAYPEPKAKGQHVRPAFALANVVPVGEGAGAPGCAARDFSTAAERLIKG